MTTLLLSSRHTADNQALWRAAVQSGWAVERVRGLHLPVGLDDEEIVLYVEALFARSIAGQLGLLLVEPEEDWLVRLPHQYRKRAIRLATLADARMFGQPMFVKPPNDKSFEARVYACGQELPDAFEGDMPVLVVEPVEFEVEYRCFVLDRTIRAMSPYLRHGRLAALDDYAAPEDEAAGARTFADELLADNAVHLPKAVVLDVGRLRENGWAVVKANAA